MAELSKTDCNALKRCIEMARTYPGRDEQISWKLGPGGCSWQETARFCAYLCQSKNLQLEIMEFPPCWLLDVEDTEGPSFKRKPEAARLLKRLLDAGLSKYEPDPVRALAAAEKLQAAEIKGSPQHTAGAAGGKSGHEGDEARQRYVSAVE